MSFALKLVNGVPRMVNLAASIYDETFVTPSTITAGTPITLPNSGTYTGIDLEVYFNGAKMTVIYDYNYVGSGTRTQISMTFDLVAGAEPDLIRFRKEV